MVQGDLKLNLNHNYPVTAMGQWVSFLQSLVWPGWGSNSQPRGLTVDTLQVWFLVVGKVLITAWTILRNFPTSSNPTARDTLWVTMPDTWITMTNNSHNFHPNQTNSVQSKRIAPPPTAKWTAAKRLEAQSPTGSRWLSPDRKKHLEHHSASKSPIWRFGCEAPPLACPRRLTLWGNLSLGLNAS